MWCICTKAPVGFKERAPGEIWVCSRCEQPTLQYFNRLTAMLGPNDAICLLSDHGRRDGVHELRWDTKSGRKTTLVFLPYPMKVGMEYQSSLLHKLWHTLDDEVDFIQTDRPVVVELDQVTHKARARMLAEVLHTLMQPFYESPDAVVHEAMARYRDRQAGTEHETPGLGEKLWDPNARWDGSPYGIPATTTKKSKRTGKSIPPSSLGSVRQGIESGMFTVSQIAQMYDVSSDEVKEQLGIA